MRIVADENIPLIDQFFGDFGDIIRVPGRTMTAADVADADLLLVRSVTQVNEALLSGSKVKFVGTATIGVVSSVCADRSVHDSVIRNSESVKW